MTALKSIEVSLVLINGTLTNNKKDIYDILTHKYSVLTEFKFVNRRVFEFMEVCDLWREKQISKLPSLFIFTKEQWQLAHEKGLAHG